MTGRTAIALLAFLLTSSEAPAQTPPSAEAAPRQGEERYTAGEIDIGGRVTSFEGDRARVQRFRDAGSGFTLQRLRYTRERNVWVFGAQIDHAGYDDQRYQASVERLGQLEAEFEWDQVPLFYGDVTRSPFRAAAPGVLRLDDALQLAVQNRTATIADYGSLLSRFDTRSRRDIARARVAYGLTSDLGLHFAFTSTHREGEQPWGASFGFSNANEVALSIDHRTNDLTTAAEWSTERGMVRVAYDGSWFDNAVETLVWDNPLRAADQTHSNAYSAGDGPAQGRMALWPDSTAHTVSAAGSLALPARSRAFAYVSVGSWLQDAELLPHTINSAIAPIPLARPTAEAEARITAMNYRFTSRPTRALWISGQYRLYDYDNRTPHFPVEQYVRLDGNVASSITGGSEPFGYTRHFVDVDASYSLWRGLAVRAGYGQEDDDRTFRYVEQTTDRVFRVSADSTGLAWGSVRVQYDRSVRTGDGLDEQVLSDIGEQVSLRQFDISDRTRDRVSAILQYTPAAFIGVTTSAAVGQEHRPDAAFGLQDNDLRAFTIGVDVVPDAAVGGTVTYGFENYSTRQQSRQANPGAQFNDPARDWWTDMDEDVHTVGLRLDFGRPADRVAVSGGYDYVGSKARYVYSVRPETTLAIPQQLPSVNNRLHTGVAELQYRLVRQTALAVGYRFDHYEVEDFSLSPGALNSALVPTFLNLMNQWRPYRTHSGSVRLLYSW